MLDFSVKGKWAAVALDGEFDIAAGNEVPRAVAELVGRGVTDFALDVGRVTFMDCAGAGQLMAAADLVPSGRVIVVGARGSLARMFRVTGIDQVLAIFDHPAAAPSPGAAGPNP
ncbi:MAG: STAS domain-containing protein, partial [Pseudonocardiaceae bacterium]